MAAKVAGGVDWTPKFLIHANATWVGGVYSVCVAYVCGINQSNTNQSLNQTWRSSFFRNGAVECKTKEQHWVQAIKLIKNVCKISLERAKGRGRWMCMGWSCGGIAKWKWIENKWIKLHRNLIKTFSKSLALSIECGQPEKFTARVSSIMHKLRYFWGLIWGTTAVNLRNAQRRIQEVAGVTRMRWQAEDSSMEKGQEKSFQTDIKRAWKGNALV